ncbi:hypothetical protein TNCV_3044281 [Trichonephila clavipes]|nr:hypothetical protein TNCV_3044281 [Trichonephila clavipes]
MRVYCNTQVPSVQLLGIWLAKRAPSHIRYVYVDRTRSLHVLLEYLVLPDSNLLSWNKYLIRIKQKALLRASKSEPMRAQSGRRRAGQSGCSEEP